MKLLKGLTILIFTFMLALGLYFVITFHTPPHYRTTDSIPSPFRQLSGYFHGYKSFDTKGLNELNSIASGYLDFHHLDQLLQSTSSPIIVLNGMNGDIHYLNGKNLKFYCLKYNGDQITSVERGSIKNKVCKARQLISGIISPANDNLPLLKTEEDLLSEREIEYHVPLPKNWLSDWGFMDNLISFFDEVDKDSTLYFHCGHGQGRTTSMLVLWDIYNNARNVPIHDILSRQYLLGGEDLLDTEEWQNGTWTSPHLMSRRDLVLAFHKYMNASDGYNHMTWSKWLAKHNLEPQINTHTASNR